MRTAYIAVSFLIGATVSYISGDFIVENETAIGIFVTVYTVLAGFLVAVITVLGDPALLPHGSWRAAELHREKIEARLIRHTWLFALYLVTIGVIFVGALLSGAPEDMVSSEIKGWVARVHLTLGVAAFMLTLAMPAMLIDVQRRRVDAEIDRRKEADKQG